MANESEGTPKETYKLMYWDILGRGEFIRLALAASGSAWEEAVDWIPNSYVKAELNTPYDSPQPRGFAPPFLQ